MSSPSKGITQGNHDVWNLDSSRARRDSTVRAPVTRPTRCITEPDTSRNETSEPLSIIRWSLPQTTPTERASATPRRSIRACKPCTKNANSDGLEQEICSVNTHRLQRESLISTLCSVMRGPDSQAHSLERDMLGADSNLVTPWCQTILTSPNLQSMVDG